MRTKSKINQRGSLRFKQDPPQIYGSLSYQKWDGIRNDTATDREGTRFVKLCIGFKTGWYYYLICAI